MKVKVLLAILVLCATLFACSDENKGMIEYDGRLLSEDELQAIITATLQTEPEIVIQLVRFGENEVEESARLYWTSGGSVWHTRLSCGYLSKDGDVYYGTLEEAISAEKSRCCSACEKNEK